MIVDNIIVGKRCPYCGGAITACTPIRVRNSYRTAPDDEVGTTVINGNRYSGELVTEYVYTISGHCKPCGRAFSYAQMEDGEPNPPMYPRSMLGADR